MYKNWMPLQGLLNKGGPFILTDQDIWLSPIREFEMDCRILEPIQAEISLFPQDDGLLVRGSITGRVAMPCNLCAEDAVVDMDQAVESFEPYPQEPGQNLDEPDPDVDEYFIRFSPQGTGLEVNLYALAWEEFCQALPMQPMCSQNCAGLCPHCGRNLNQEQCSCPGELPDPRMDKLRGLKIN